MVMIHILDCILQIFLQHSVQFWLHYFCHCHLAVEHALNGCNESELQLQIVFCHALNNNSYRQIFNCFGLQIESSNWISSFCVNNSQRVSRCFQLHNYPFIMPRKKRMVKHNGSYFDLNFHKNWWVLPKSCLQARGYPETMLTKGGT